MRSNLTRSTTLDLVRGLAAVAVCAGHLRAAMFVNYGQLETSSIVQKIFYAATSLGHEAVMIFFVLSGFLVGGSLLRQKDNFKWLQYVIARLTRLWIVLLPALLFTVLVDQIVQLFHPEVFLGAYSKVWASGPDLVGYSRDWHVFIGNVFFQQTVFVPIYGSNSPSWSLANEFYYYAIFPMLMLSIGYLGKPKRTVIRIIFGIIGVIILNRLPGGFAEGFLVFCMGALVSWYEMKSVRHKAGNMCFVILGLMVFLFAIYLSKSTMLFQYGNKDLLIGLGFSVLLTTLMQSRLSFRIVRHAAAFMADISYSLYLTHFPVVLLIAASFYGIDRVRLDAIGAAQFTVWLGLILSVAIIFWYLFERHTDLVKKVILKFVAQKMYRKLI